MSYNFDCPYLDKEHHGVIYCECGRIAPPDKVSRTEFLSKYCGHATGYKECPFHKLLDDYYKRKYSTEVDKW